MSIEYSLKSHFENFEAIRSHLRTTKIPFYFEIGRDSFFDFDLVLLFYSGHILNNFDALILEREQKRHNNKNMQWQILDP